MINTILYGDSRTVIKTIPDGIADTCVTSTPYYNQRDYGTGEWIGGDINCKHTKYTNTIKHATHKSTLQGSKETQLNNARVKDMQRGTCKKCGATYKDDQIGLESTPEEFTKEIFDVLMETKRILKPTGSLWLNLGDSYCSTAGGSKAAPLKNIKRVGKEASAAREVNRPIVPKSLKPKDLIGIPWRIAFALQGFAVVPFYTFTEWADLLSTARSTQDWELVEFVENIIRNMDLMVKLAPYWHRCDIIWAKPNPMPESVTDRPTRAHEYIFLLTKSRNYYYDAEAIKTETKDPVADVRKNRSNKKRTPTRMVDGMRNSGLYPLANKRSVWSVTTSAFNEDHYATFPQQLIVDCIKAGTSEYGCCAECGKPYRRILKKVGTYTDGRMKSSRSINVAEQYGGESSTNGVFKTGELPVTKTIGWKKTCKCKTEEVKPAIVFDPFAGTGTTLLVGEKLNRAWLGIELNKKNIKLAKKRQHQEFGIFNPQPNPAPIMDEVVVEEQTIDLFASG